VTHEPSPIPPDTIASPPQVEPIGVAAPAPLAPLNALPLDYVPPSYNARPGLVTAIGVMSIVVAVISGFASFGYGLGGFLLWMTSQIKVPATTSTTVKTTPVAGGMSSFSVTTSNSPLSVNTASGASAAIAPPALRLVVGPHGLEEPQRRTVVLTFRQSSTLSDQRAKMLDSLLADSGQDLFTFGASGMTAANVAASVSDSGQVHKLSGEAGPDYFVLGTGRLELYDDHAVFMPSDGREPVRVSEADVEAEGEVLSKRDVDAIVASAQKRCVKKLTPAQTMSLTNMLAGAGQGLINKSINVPPASQVTAVIVQPDGSAMIQTMSGVVMMDAKGVVTYSMSNAGMFGGPGGSPFKVSGGGAALVMVTSALSMALAIYLLVIGIITLRQSLRGRQLHLIYAVIKIPLAILAAIGVYWMASSFMTNLPTVPRSSSAGAAAGMFYAMMAGFGIIYPIALMITLSTRRIREYYSDVR